MWGCPRGNGFGAEPQQQLQAGAVSKVGQSQLWEDFGQGGGGMQEQREDPGGIDLCSPLIKPPRAPRAVILSRVHHPVNQSNPSSSASEQAPAAAEQEHETAPHLPFPHLGEGNKESLTQGIPGCVPEPAVAPWGDPGHCSSGFCPFPVFPTTLCAVNSGAHAAGMLLERACCGIWGCDALVVPPAVVLMEIPGISESWLRGERP